MFSWISLIFSSADDASGLLVVGVADVFNSTCGFSTITVESTFFKSSSDVNDDEEEEEDEEDDDDVDDADDVDELDDVDGDLG